MIKKDFWDSATIIFDTSAICKMYDMTEETKQTMVKILDHIKSKVWIPGHVMSEYLRNREKVITNPLREKYKSPSVFSTTALKTEGRQFLQKLENQGYYHPYISKEVHEQISDKLEKALRCLSDIEDEIKKEFKIRKDEINHIVSSDIILKEIETLTKGSDFDYNKMTAICQEGEFRYRNSIPPGYLDFNGKDGFQKYGDLFIWFQIIEYAASSKQNVILITDDVKPDWWENPKHGILRPELYQEFHDKTDRQIQATTLEGFISLLEEIFKDEHSLPFYQGLEAVKDALDYAVYFANYDDHFIDLKCNKCNKKFRYKIDDIDWDWEECGWSELEMGTETQYVCKHYMECGECEDEICITFTLNEYPAGRVEDLDVEIEGAEIGNDPNFLKTLPLPFSDDAEQCLYCGRWTHSLIHDMCPECLDEFNYKVSHD